MPDGAVDGADGAVSDTAGAEAPPVEAKDEPDVGGGDDEGTVEEKSFFGKLKVVGTQLCGSDGEAVQLRGVSTHGMAWFSDYVNLNCFR